MCCHILGLLAFIVLVEEKLLLLLCYFLCVHSVIFHML